MRAKYEKLPYPLLEKVPPAWRVLLEPIIGFVKSFNKQIIFIKSLQKNRQQNSCLSVILPLKKILQSEEPKRDQMVLQ